MSQAITREQFPVVTKSGNSQSALAAWRPLAEYLMEAGEIALYMLLVCTFATLVLQPTSPVPPFHPKRHAASSYGILSRFGSGRDIMTPWGKQSGHFNPAITLTFSAREIGVRDVVFYVARNSPGCWRIESWLCASRCAKESSSAMP